jgi:hypothetical protein
VSTNEHGEARPEDLAAAPAGSGSSSEPTSPEPAAPADWQARVTRLGRAGVVVYALVQIATITAFYAALMSPEVRSQPFIAEHMGEGSSLFSAWLLSKALIVPRAAFTCLITPLVARPINAAWARVSGRAG